MAKDGVTVLVTTHYMDEAELCQLTGFINRGKLEARETPARLKQAERDAGVRFQFTLFVDNADAMVSSC